jgi:PAS domain S-box-containing protein
MGAMKGLSVGLGGRSFAQAMLEAIPSATVMVSGSGRIIYVNRRVESLLGWSPHEVIGRDIECLVPSPSGSSRLPPPTDDMAPSSNESTVVHGGLVTTNNHSTDLSEPTVSSFAPPTGPAQATLSTRGRVTRSMSARAQSTHDADVHEYSVEVELRRRDGITVPIEVNVSPLRFNGEDLMLIELRDGRPQRGLRQALVIERDRAQSVIDSLQDGVLELDLVADRYAAANPRFCEMVGLSADDVLSTTSMPPWWNPAEAATIKMLRDSAAAGEVARYEIGMVHSSGREFRALVTANLVHSGDQPTLLGLFHDLTDEREAVDELDAARSRLAILEDRDRIGRDLHDGVIQRLFAAGLHLQAAIGRPDRDERVISVIDEIDDAIKQIRTTVFTLHGKRGLRSGLEHALRVALAESSRLLGHEPKLDISGRLRDVPDALGLEMVSLVRELLANVVKHASATATFVRVAIVEGVLTLEVADNGVGFEVDAVEAGSGVKSLQERALAHNGRAQLRRRRPTGTEVRWSVPLDEPTAR